MPLLTRDQILSARDVMYEDVAVPEWGGSVRVRSLSGRERDAYQKSVTRIKGSDVQVVLEDMRAKLVAKTAVSGEGSPLFTEGDVAALADKNAAVVERLFDASLRLCGLAKADVEEMVKNYVNSQSSDSGST